MNEELAAGYEAYKQAAMVAIDRVIAELETQEGFDKDLLIDALDEYTDLFEEYGQLR